MEINSKITGKPPKITMEAVRFLTRKARFITDKARRELGLPTSLLSGERKSLSNGAESRGIPFKKIIRP
jgi:hypothetical protein